MLKGINMRITTLHFVTQSWCWWEVWAILRSFQPQFDDLFSLLFFSSFHFANPAEVRFQKLRWVKSGRVLVQACDDVPKIPLTYLIISRAHDLYTVFFQHAAACGIHTDVHDCWSAFRCLIRTWPYLIPSRRAKFCFKSKTRSRT